MPPAIGGTLTIIFDAGISSVTMFGTTITTSGGSISDFSTGYPETCVGTFVLNSGYAIDTITFNADYAEAGTLSGYTNSDFSIDAGVGSISGTLTITTKEATSPYNIVIKNKEGIKLLTKDKTIEFTDDVKVTIDESLLGGGEAEPQAKVNWTINYNMHGGTLYLSDGYKQLVTPNSSGTINFVGGPILYTYGHYSFAGCDAFNLSGPDADKFNKVNTPGAGDECGVVTIYPYYSDVDGVSVEYNVTLTIDMYDD